MNKVVNFAAFQVGWFACILGAANGMPGLGPVAVVALLTPRLAHRDRITFVLRMSTAAGVGFVVDTLLLRAGVLRIGAESVSPLWMTALWPNLATTLDSSLDWLSRRYVLAAACGGLAAPLAYYGGDRLGALRLDPSPSAFAAVACVWMAALPALVLLTDRTVPNQEVSA